MVIGEQHAAEIAGQVAAVAEARSRADAAQAAFYEAQARHEDIRRNWKFGDPTDELALTLFAESQAEDRASLARSKLKDEIRKLDKLHGWHCRRH